MRRSGWDEEGYPLFEMFEPFDESAHFKSFPLVSYGPYSLIHPMGGTLGDLNLDGRWDSISTYSLPVERWEQKRAVFGIFVRQKHGLWRTGAHFPVRAPPGSKTSIKSPGECKTTSTGMVLLTC